MRRTHILKHTQGARRIINNQLDKHTEYLAKHKEWETLIFPEMIRAIEDQKLRAKHLKKGVTNGHVIMFTLGVPATKILGTTQKVTLSALLPHYEVIVSVTRYWVS